VKRNARRISTVAWRAKLEDDVDLSPEREQAAVTVRTMLVKYTARAFAIKNRMHYATQFELDAPVEWTGIQCNCIRLAVSDVISCAKLEHIARPIIRISYHCSRILCDTAASPRVHSLSAI